MSDGKSLTFFSHLVVLIVFLALCSLGMWQSQRYSAKMEREAQIEAKQQQFRFSLKEIIDYQEDIRDLPTFASGQVQSDRIFLLDNRQFEGQVGYEVIVPMQTQYGAVLVNFGWIKAPELRSELPNIVLPEQINDTEAMVTIPGMNRFVSETATDDGVFPKVIQEVDFGRLSKFSEIELLPFMLTLIETDVAFKRRWQPVVMPAMKHLGYAAQWFGLAIALVVIYWRLGAKRNRK